MVPLLLELTLSSDRGAEVPQPVPDDSGIGSGLVTGPLPSHAE